MWQTSPLKFHGWLLNSPSESFASCTRLRAISQYSLLISIPMYFLPISSAATRVVPDPVNGSNTSPPVGVAVILHRYFIRSSGFTVGWWFALGSPNTKADDTTCRRRASISYTQLLFSYQFPNKPTGSIRLTSKTSCCLLDLLGAGDFLLFVAFLSGCLVVPTCGRAQPGYSCSNLGSS